MYIPPIVKFEQFLSRELKKTSLDLKSNVLRDLNIKFILCHLLTDISSFHCLRGA